MAGNYEDDDDPIMDPNAVPIPDPTPSTWDSLLQGAGQGITMGYGDEAGGALEAVTGRKEDESLMDAYLRGRDELRRIDTQASDTNPKSYYAGYVPGALASGVAAAPYVGAAASGALGGLGASDSDTLKGVAGDTALGALGGKAGEKIVGVAGPLVKKLLPKAPTPSLTEWKAGMTPKERSLFVKYIDYVADNLSAEAKKKGDKTIAGALNKPRPESAKSSALYSSPDETRVSENPLYRLIERSQRGKK